MSEPDLVLVAHGTREPRGVATVRQLAAAVRAHGVVVHLAFVDVLGPTVAEVLTTVAGPVVLVPAFLAAGYHVRSDVPAEVRASGHPAVHVSAALGPDPALAAVQRVRLLEAGWRPGDAVVLAAVGSGDPLARDDVHTAAELLSEELGVPLRHGYAVAAEPTVRQAVSQLRTEAARRVVISPYLLAPGLFHAQLGDAGADAVAAPMGVHPAVVELVLQRYRRGSRPPATG